MSATEGDVRTSERRYVNWIAGLALLTGLTTNVTVMWVTHLLGWSGQAPRAAAMAAWLWTTGVAAYPWVEHVRSEHGLSPLRFTGWVLWVSAWAGALFLFNMVPIERL